MRRRIAWYVYLLSAKLCRNLWQGRCVECGSPIGISESYHPYYWSDPDVDGDGICSFCRYR